jgi:hypothetical protein
MPSQLQQDHVNELIKLPPMEQRALIHKLLAVAVRNFREAEEVQAAAIDRNQPSRNRDATACAARSLPAGHDRRIVNKIINNFDRLCTQALAPGATHRISTEDDEEDWLLVKPKGDTDAKPFYYEKNSNRTQWEKPLTGKTRCESKVARLHAIAIVAVVVVVIVAFPQLLIGTCNMRAQITSSLNCCESTSLSRAVLVSVPPTQNSQERLRTALQHIRDPRHLQTSRACSFTTS